MAKLLKTRSLKTPLSIQAENSISLYRGQSPSSIKQLLSFQRQSVVNELLEYYGCTDTGTLSVKLSML